MRQVLTPRILAIFLFVLPIGALAIGVGSTGPVNLPTGTPCTSVSGTYRVSRGDCIVDMDISECIERPSGGCHCAEGEVDAIVSGGGPWGPCDSQPTTGGPVWTLY